MQVINLARKTSCDNYKRFQQLGMAKRCREKEDLGPYSYGIRNKEAKNNFKIINTFFKKKKKKEKLGKWTDLSTNEKTRNQIDYFLAPKNKNYIRNFKVLDKFEFHSSYRSIEIKMNILSENLKFHEEVKFEKNTGRK